MILLDIVAIFPLLSKCGADKPKRRVALFEDDGSDPGVALPRNSRDTILIKPAIKQVLCPQNTRPAQ